MLLQPAAAGDAAAIMAALYIALVVETGISQQFWKFSGWVSAISGMGLFLPAPMIVVDLILLLGAWELSGPGAWAVLSFNVLAVAAQVFYLLAAWNEAERGDPKNVGHEG